MGSRRSSKVVREGDSGAEKWGKGMRQEAEAGERLGCGGVIVDGQQVKEKEEEEKNGQKQEIPSYMDEGWIGWIEGRIQ